MMKRYTGDAINIWKPAGGKFTMTGQQGWEKIQVFDPICDEPATPAAIVPDFLFFKNADRSRAGNTGASHAPLTGAGLAHGGIFA
jgi:hypothetical protein